VKTASDKIVRLLFA